MSEFNFETEKQLLKNKIACYPDFPKPGIIFRDMFSLLADPPSFEMVSRLLENEIKVHCANVDVIVGLEARGFVLAAPLSLSFRKPFVPVRKQKKLPGKVSHKEFSLEYGTMKTMEEGKEVIAEIIAYHLRPIPVRRNSERKLALPFGRNF